MITSNPADALPHSASELLLSLNHLPSEEKLAQAKRLKYHVLLDQDIFGNCPRIHTAPKEWLPHNINSRMIVLPDMDVICKIYPEDTLTESLEAAVRGYAVRGDYVFVHEMSNGELDHTVGAAVSHEPLDLAAAKFRRILFPELRRRGRDEAEITKIGQDFISRVMSNLFWRDKIKKGIFLDEPFNNHVGVRDARFIRVINNMREAMNCDNRTLLGGSAVNPHRIIAWAAEAGTRIESLVRDAVEMTREVKPDRAFDRTTDSIHGQALELTEFLSEKFSGRWFCRKLRHGYSAATVGELIKRAEERLEDLERQGAPRTGEYFGHKEHWDRRVHLRLPLNPAYKALRQLKAYKALRQLKPWYELDPQLLADMLNT